MADEAATLDTADTGAVESAGEPTIDSAIEGAVADLAGESSEPTESVTPTQAETYSVTVDGEAVEGLTLDDLKAGYQRQADYTRKTQELGDAKRQAEAFQKLDDWFKSDPQAALKELSSQYGVELNESPATVPATAPEEGGEGWVDPETAAIESRISEVEAWKREQDRNTEQAAVEAQIEEYRNIHAPDASPQEYMERVAEYANEKGVYNLEVVADILAIQDMAAATEANVVDSKREAPPVEGGSARTQNNADSVPSGGLDLDDAVAAALSDLQKN